MSWLAVVVQWAQSQSFDKGPGITSDRVSRQGHAALAGSRSRLHLVPRLPRRSGKPCCQETAQSAYSKTVQKNDLIAWHRIVSYSMTSKAEPTGTRQSKHWLVSSVLLRSLDSLKPASARHSSKRTTKQESCEVSSNFISVFFFYKDTQT